MSLKKLSSIEWEKVVLASLIQIPDQVYPLICNTISEKDFVHEENNIIFSILFGMLERREQVNIANLSQKIKNYGLTLGGLAVFDYLNALNKMQVSEHAALEAAKGLKNFRIRRDIYNNGLAAQTIALSNLNDPPEKVIAEVDSVYNNQVMMLDSEGEPINLFDGMEDIIDERIKNPAEEIGIPTPSANFNRLYGGLIPGNVYAFVARFGEGKTTFLTDWSFNIAKQTNFNYEVLYLDTEMEEAAMRDRIVASIAGVAHYSVVTGNLDPSKDELKKIKEFYQKKRKGNYKFYCKYVGNKNIDEVCNIIRRFYYKRIGRNTGKGLIVVYDYIKLTGEKVSQNWGEHQAIGDKVDKLKNIVMELPNTIGLTSMQMNRSGDNLNKRSEDLSDNSTAIAQSDRLVWFGSSVFILRRKTLDEIEEDGIEFGTHKLIRVKTRFQGRDARGHHDFVQRVSKITNEKRYTWNYINLNIDNFLVEERGTLEDIVKAQSNNANIQDHDGDDHSVNL